MMEVLPFIKKRVTNSHIAQKDDLVLGIAEAGALLLHLVLFSSI
jgi:hypothetical protein